MIRLSIPWMILLLGVVAIGSALPVSAKAQSGSSWMDFDWGYRRAITIDNRGNPESSGPQEIYVTPPGDEHMAPDLRDVRFTGADGAVLLDCWKDAGGSVNGFWVGIPEIPAMAETTIYMYYGNRSAPDVSNGAATFLFFDDFEGNGAFPPLYAAVRGKYWVKYAENPILSSSATGWDSYGLRDPMLLVDANGRLVREDGNFVMYYRGNQYDPDFYESADHIRRQIGRALSPDGIHWTKDDAHNPVLTTGTPGEWDDAFIGSAWAIKEGDRDYRLYYDGYSGLVSGIGLARSDDGIHWTKYEGNPILKARDWPGIPDSTTVVAIVSALKRARGDYLVFTEVGPPVKAIFGAISEDGIRFTALNDGQPLLTGSPHQWDFFQAANPKVIEIGTDQYLMGYNGRGALQHQLGFAYSTDLVHWTKYRENPVVFLGEPDSWEGGRIENALIAKDDLGTNVLRMWYFGCPGTDAIQDCSIGYAVCQQDAPPGPLGWWATYGDPEVSSEQVLSGANAIKIDGGAGESIRRFVNRIGSFALRFHVYFTTSSGILGTFSVIDGQSTAIQMKYENGHLYYEESGPWIDLGPVAAGSWHTIELTADTRTNLVSVSIDGIDAGEYEPFSGVIVGLTYLELAGASSSSYYVDDVTVRRVCMPIPPLMIGDEISSESWLAVSPEEDGRLLSLGPAVPNPSQGPSTLDLLLPRAGKVRLTIIDAAGRRLRTLLNGRTRAGSRTIAWDGRDDDGRLAPSGIYWAVIQSDNGQRTRKLEIIR